MAASPQRQLIEAVGTRLQVLTGSGHSGIDLSSADRTHYGRWGRKLPGSPPLAFVYMLTQDGVPQGLQHSRTRAPTIFVDAWIGKASSTALHLVAIDLGADLRSAFEDADWLRTTRTGLTLTSLQLTGLTTRFFPGHLFAHPDRELVRAELAFSWRTPCS